MKNYVIEHVMFLNNLKSSINEITLRTSLDIIIYVFT